MKKAFAIAGAGVLALSLAACGSSGSGGSSGPHSTGASAAKYANGKTFTMVLSSDPGNLDPDMTSLSAAYQVELFLYDSLLNLGKDGTTLEAGLAAKWTGNATKATYTLRNGITCSDGAKLTASVVADNINYVANPKNKSTRLGVFVPPGVKASADDGAGTVTVTSAAPAAFLTRQVGRLPIVCAKGMKNRSMLKRAADGTGPFTLTKASPNNQYTLTARKGYTWGPGKDYDATAPGHPVKVVLKVVSNESTAANLVLSGQVNATQLVGPDRKRLASQNLFHQNIVANLGEMWLNHKPGGPTSDEAVRKALVQALDLKQLAQVVGSGTGTPPTGLIAPKQGPCSTNDTVSGNLPGHDVSAAKKALDAAGWKLGSGGVRSKNGTKLALVFYYPTSVGPAMESGAELIQKQWKAIGVKASIKAATDTQLAQTVLGGQGHWDGSIIPVNTPLPTQLVPFLSGPTPPKGNNFSYIDNATYNAKAKKASTQVGSAGCPDWEAGEKALFRHADAIPFVDSSVPVFAKGATFALRVDNLAPTSIRMLG